MRSELPVDEKGDIEDDNRKLRTIFELEEVLRKALLDLHEVHEQCKDAKNQVRSAQDNLNAYIKSLKKEMPLFDNHKEPEDWRDVPLSRIEGLSLKVLASFEKEGVNNLGTLFTWLRTHELTDLQGVGGKKNERIQELIDAFWETHPEILHQWSVQMRE